MNSPYKAARSKRAILSGIRFCVKALAVNIVIKASSFMTMDEASTSFAELASSGRIPGHVFYRFATIIVAM